MSYIFPDVFFKQGDKDFPPAAAQVAHQKPHPSVEKLPHPQHVKQHIHQPRKWALHQNLSQTAISEHVWEKTMTLNDLHYQICNIDP